MAGENFRIERDSMGEVKVPSEAYYGAQTRRAVENFPVSGIGFPRQFIRALATVKHAAASANEELGLLDPRLASAIRQAADEVMEGKPRRSICRRYFSDRLRYVNQHECERSHRQQGTRDFGQAAQQQGNPKSQ